MRGNKMGPEEKGPKTGRGLGYCNGSDSPGYMSSEAPQGMRRGGGRGAGGFGRRGGGYGRGFGGGFGGGFGRRGFVETPDSGVSTEKLAARVEELEKALAKFKK